MANRPMTLALLSCLLAPTSAGAVPPAGPVRTDLLMGATWQYSIDDGKTFSPRPVTVAPRTKVEVLAQATFDVAKTEGMVCLELVGLPPVAGVFALNGRPLRGPLDGMRYDAIPAIDPGGLKAKANVLSFRGRVHNRLAEPRTVALAPSLVALQKTALRIQTGPVLGAFADGWFSVTCRTNMVADVSVVVAGANGRTRVLAGPSRGLHHRLKVKAAPEPDGRVLVRARVADVVRSAQITPPAPVGQDFRFVVAGDSRTRWQDWAKVAAAVAKVRPVLIVFAGDMVTNGRNDGQWDREFFAPGRQLFAAIPFYGVMGNHEQNAPLYRELFYSPGPDSRSKNWAQQVGSVLLIGIDGQTGFAAGSENAKWLETRLAASKAKFIFLTNHYPAWSSSAHGWLDKHGRPGEKSVRESREVVLPLLVKYGATAMFAGHDHCYERSEPPKITHVTTGGAGAPLRRKTKNAQQQNPHSKVFAAKLHYCVLDVRGDTCAMTVRTPTGEVIDRRTWKARPAAAAKR